MILYKFRPINKFTEDLVKDGSLWFSRMSDLNDPFEGDFTFSQKYIDENFIKHSTLPQQGNFEYHKALAESFRERKRSHLFIMSLTEKLADTVMWSHYADNHAGLVVGIEFAETNEEQFPEADVQFIKRNDSYIHDVAYNSSPVVIDDNSLEEFSKIFLRKSEQWAYEAEKRIAFKDDSIHAPGKSISVHPSKIKEVHFGARTSRQTIDTFISKVGRQDEIEYQKMSFIHGYFKLASCPI